MSDRGAGTGGEVRLEEWFAARGWAPFDYQRRVWAAHRARESGLVQVPTGLGKTLAAIGGVVQEALATCDAEGEVERGGLRVLWITPLRALARDTSGALQDLFDDIGLPWRVGLRTGDTGSARKKKQRTDPPEILVTTPESLSILLSYPERDRLFRDLDAVVVDEWHELLGSKRGVLLELSLAHLRARRPDLVVRGLSATLGNPEEALAVLLGAGAPQGRIDTGPRPGALEIEVLLPDDVLRFPWAGHIGLALLDRVVDALEPAESALLFTNTRAQAELWHRALTEARPDWAESIALHHGSISRADRTAAEEGIAEGRLKAIVCTSSLDLGVDFQPVERVFQIGSPKGLGRLLQRAGRSGHRPGATRRLFGVPAHAFEIAEFVAARRAVARGEVEPRPPITGAFDVLAQHVVTLAVGGGVAEREVLAEARSTHAFAELGDEAWQWVLDFVTRGGALHAYERYHRLHEEQGMLKPATSTLGRRHRPTIGTITDDGALEVRYLKGARLGTVEESFLGRLSPGDRFLFAGRELELVRIRDMRAYVRNAKRSGGPVPRWAGGRLPLSSHLADAVATLLAEVDPAVDEAAALDPLLSVQDAWSARPGPDRLLIEYTRSREGEHAFLFPFLGRLAHEGLSMLVAWRWTAESPRTVHVSVNDYGIEFLSDGGLPPDEATWRRLLRPEDLEEDLVAAMNAGELARRRFREIARVAGLVQAGTPGRPKSARNLQASAGLVFDVLEKYDPDNLFLAQARSEAMEAELEIERIRRGLEALSARPVVFTTPERLTPLAFPIWAERIQARASSESWRDIVRREAARLESAAGEVVGA